MVSKSIGLLALLGALALGAPAQAQDAPAKGKNASAALSSPYAWYDADGEHTAWLNPALIAEFSTRPASESAVARTHPAALTELASRGVARIWRLDGEGAERVLQAARAVDPAGKFSPVFSDGATDDSRKRALPGGVIVTFQSTWTEPQVRAWAAAQGLSVANKLAIGPSVYVLNTAPGFAALETANRIHRSGEVVSAEPNWWVEVSTR